MAGVQEIKRAAARPSLRHAVKSLPRPENSASRLGLVTSKKVGCAVERNTARRRFRAIFRECAPDFAVPCDILVFVRRGYAKFEYAKLREKFRLAAETVIANAKKE